MPDIDVEQWTGAWATSIPDEKLIPGDFRVLDNYVYGKDGFPTTRPGWRVLGSGLSTGTITHIAPFYPTPSSAYLMVYSDPPSGATGGFKPTLWAWHKYDSFEALGKGAIDNPAPVGGKPSSASGQGRWFFTYNAPTDSRLLYFDGKVQVTGAAGTLVGGVRLVPNDPPAAKSVFFVDNRLWVVPPDELSTFYGSAPDDTFDWTVQSNGAVRFPITAGDGGTVSSIISFGGTKLIFKDDPDGGSIHRLDEGIGGTGNIQFQRSTLTRATGALSEQLVVVVGDTQVFFAGRKGISALARTDKFGDVESSFVDFEVSDIWRSLSIAQQRRAVMVDDSKNDTILLSYDTDNDGQNDSTFYINYARRTPRGYESFSRGDFGFNAATRFSIAGTVNNDVIVARPF